MNIEILFLIALLVALFVYPVLFYRLLGMKRFGFDLLDVCISHWSVIILLIFMPAGHRMGPSFDDYSFFAANAIYWINVGIIIFHRKIFTFMDEIWVWFSYPILLFICPIAVYTYYRLYPFFWEGT